MRTSKASNGSGRRTKKTATGAHSKATPGVAAQAQMSPQIFISYRRSDSSGYAGRIQDRLQGEFGSDVVFMDVDAIRAGVNFVEAVREAVTRCSVLLVLIGPNWL